MSDSAQSADVVYRCPNGHEFEHELGNTGYESVGESRRRWCHHCKDAFPCEVIDA